MSVHIGAKKGDIAEKVLLPGDPLRAKWIAETFLSDVVKYNEVRGMHGYTGTFNGEKVSVQGTGMGVPSILIYTNELIQEYGVKKLIRIGTAGSYQANITVRDIVLAMSSSTDSGILNKKFPVGNFAPTADFELLHKAFQLAQSSNLDVKVGNIFTGDEFYDDNPDFYKQWADYGVLCVDMETAALYTVAAKFKVKALSILTISDNLVTGELISSEARQTSLEDMVNLALGI